MTDYPFDPAAELELLAASTAAFADTAQSLSDGDVRAPSLLPGWTRGHVLAHVARNADSLVNLLTWARTGVETPQYASQEARDTAIEEGSRMSAAALAADNREAAARFASAAATLPLASWSNEIRWRNGPPRPASAILWARRREVEIHHVDLAAEYVPADWSAEFTTHALGEAAKHFSRLGAGPFLLAGADSGARWRVAAPDAEPALTVSGTPSALLAWLIGRSSGTALTTDPATARLPELPDWI
jgi:maleylpyruvate isomerase